MWATNQGCSRRDWIRPVAFRILDHIVTYAATQGMSVASAPRPSRRHHRCCRFLQRYDEMADQGCCFFLWWWHILCWRGLSSRIWRTQVWFFLVSILPMSPRYIGKRGPNSVHKFSWRDSAEFLFVAYSRYITRYSMSCVVSAAYCKPHCTI